MHFSLEFAAPRNFFSQRVQTTKAEPLVVPVVRKLEPKEFICSPVQAQEVHASWAMYDVTSPVVERKANKLALEVFKDLRGKKKRLQFRLDFDCEELESYLVETRQKVSSGKALSMKEVTALDLIPVKSERPKLSLAFRKSRLHFPLPIDEDLHEIEVPLVSSAASKPRLNYKEVPVMQFSIGEAIKRPARSVPAYDLKTTVKFDLSDLLLIEDYTIEAYELTLLPVKKRRYKLKTFECEQQITDSVGSFLRLRRSLVATVKPLAVPEVEELKWKPKLFKVLDCPEVESKPPVHEGYCFEARKPLVLPELCSNQLVQIDADVRLKRKAPSLASEEPPRAKLPKAEFAVPSDQGCFKPFNETSDKVPSVQSTPQPKDAKDVRVTVLSSVKDLEVYFSEKPKKQVRFNSQIDFFPFGSAPKPEIALRISRSSKLTAVYDYLIQWEGLHVTLVTEEQAGLDIAIGDSAGVKLIHASDLKSEAQLLARSKELDKLPGKITKLLVLLDSDSCELSQVKRLVALAELLRHDNLQLVLELSPAIEVCSESIAVFALNILHKQA